MDLTHPKENIAQFFLISTLIILQKKERLELANVHREYTKGAKQKRKGKEEQRTKPPAPQLLGS